jgi:hypothetical protein
MDSKRTIDPITLSPVPAANHPGDSRQKVTSWMMILGRVKQSQMLSLGSSHPVSGSAICIE